MLVGSTGRPYRGPLQVLRSSSGSSSRVLKVLKESFFIEGSELSTHNQSRTCPAVLAGTGGSGRLSEADEELDRLPPPPFPPPPPEVDEDDEAELRSLALVVSDMR